MRWTAVLLVAWIAIGCGEDKDRTPADTPQTSPQAEPPETTPVQTSERKNEREEMVQIALVERGITNVAALAAMRRCPRHRFVPSRLQERAYWNRPLPIGYDQTISQPTVVGSMTAQLRLTAKSKVLEIGTGSGYQAAVLAEITPHVYSIEIKKPLADRARKTLQANGYDSVKLRTGDGYYGWPEEAPFDAVIVTAAAPHVPPPLVKQLKPGGRLVIPVGPQFARQDLVLVTKDENGKVFTESLYAVAFVPLTGSLGKRGE